MIAAARAISRDTQEDLAALLTAISGQQWTRANVANIENGRRAFEVQDLPLFAAAQDRPLSWYLSTDEGTVPAAPSRHTIPG